VDEPVGFIELRETLTDWPFSFSAVLTPGSGGQSEYQSLLREYLKPLDAVHSEPEISGSDDDSSSGGSSRIANIPFQR
jgi:hypothetical protein